MTRSVALMLLGGRGPRRIPPRSLSLSLSTFYGSRSERTLVAPSSPKLQRSHPRRGGQRRWQIGPFLVAREGTVRLASGTDGGTRDSQFLSLGAWMGMPEFPCSLFVSPVVDNGRSRVSRAWAAASSSGNISKVQALFQCCVLPFTPRSILSSIL